MKDYAFLVFIVLIKVLVSLTEDFPPSVSCNMELLTWQDAGINCIRRGGKMFPYETGLGRNIDKLHLKSEIDVWTADYLIISDTEHYFRTDKYCGFNYLNSTVYENNETFYGDCYANRNYFCINKAGNLVVYNNSREKIDCDDKISLTDLHRMKSAIKPGFYWVAGTLYGTVGIASTEARYIKIQGILCGAYRSSIGMYYANCSSNGSGLINNFCYDGINTTIAWTTVRQETTTDKTHTSTKQSLTGMTTSVEYNSKEKKRHTKEDEQSSDVWIYVVVPLGVVLSLTFGIGFIIYIYRKVSEQNDYETLEHQQCDEHEYSSARQVAKDRVAINTYVNDVVYRADK